MATGRRRAGVGDDARTRSSEIVLLAPVPHSSAVLSADGMSAVRDGCVKGFVFALVFVLPRRGSGPVPLPHIPLCPACHTPSAVHSLTLYLVTHLPWSLSGGVDSELRALLHSARAAVLFVCRRCCGRDILHSPHGCTSLLAAAASCLLYS